MESGERNTLSKQAMQYLDKINQICKENESVREVVQKLGYAPNGGGTAKRIK